MGRSASVGRVSGGAITLGGVRVATLRFTPETPLEEAMPA